MGCQRCLPCARRAPLEVKSCRLLTGRGFLTGWRESDPPCRPPSHEAMAGLKTTARQEQFNGKVGEKTTKDQALRQR